MATDAASLIIEVDSSDVTKGTDELDKLSDAGGRAEKAAAKFAAQAQAMGDKLTGVGKKMSLGVTLPLTAFGIGAFNAAKDAAELDSAFSTTFGSMTATMHKWADETGNALGRSTREMKEAANTFGIFFNTAVPQAKAAEMSRTFAVLAQDLGSFFNVDTAVAIEKLRAGLSGETEPLRAFGVFLNEASVKAKALELGLIGAGNELTEQEKIQARYALILEQTAKAQGDVQRTSEGTANQLRAAQAAWEELQIVVGTKLLPALTPLIEKVGALLNWFVQLPAPVQTAVVGLAAFSAAAGPVLLVVGGILKLAGPLLPLVLKLGTAWTVLSTAIAAARVAALAALPALTPFLIPLGLLAAAVAAVYLAWRNWDKITAIVQRVYAGVKTWLVDKFGAVVESVKAKVESVTGFFRNMWDKVVGNSYVPDMVEGIADEFGKLPQVMVEPAAAATGAVGSLFEKMPQMSPFERWAESIPQSAAQIQQAFEEIGVRGLDGLSSAITEVIMGTRSLGEAFSDMARQIIADIIQMTIRMLIFRAISGMFRGGSSSEFGVDPVTGEEFIPSAKGNVFSGGNIIPFAAGGIVSGPTLFPMSGGKTGLMGEAGPEAVMPLARDSRGRLGVRANDNAPVQIELTVHSSPSPDAWAAVEAISVNTLRRGAPQIVKVAVNQSAKALTQRKLMGGRA